MEKNPADCPAREVNPAEDDHPSRSGSKPESPSDKPFIPCSCHITAEKPNMSCGSHKTGSRNLIVCIDGTANQFGDKNTNVIEMYNLILKEDQHNQRTWYNSGIGTYVRPSAVSPDFYKQWIFHKIDLAIAWDFKKTVLGAYRWLSDNYESGDCVFLFGFSRGAYQVRVLSAMIEKVGLIFKGNEMQIPFAYELYADPKSGEISDDITKVGRPTEQVSKAERFKKAFSRKDVKVHFVGAWDTVSSIGIVRGTRMLPGTIDGMTHVCYFRHALALDERRVKFLPEYAYGGCTIKPATSEDNQKGTPHSNIRSPNDSSLTEDKDALEPPSISTRSGESLPHTKEVWFAGTHSDIGGGNVQNTAMNRTRPPLRWMVFEAGAVGLRTAKFERELFANEQISIIESLTWPWLLFEICPIKRLSFTRKENGQQNTTRMPHRGSGRKIHPGQKIHSSLLRADYTIAEGSLYSSRPRLPLRYWRYMWKDRLLQMFRRLFDSHETFVKYYIPKASHVDHSFWQTLRHEEVDGISKDWQELDMCDCIRNMIKQLINNGDDTALQSLYHTAISSDARQSVYNAVIEELGGKDLTPDVKHRFLHAAMGFLKKISQVHSDFKLSFSAKIRPLLLDLGDKEGYHQTAEEFMALFTDPCCVIHLQNFGISNLMMLGGKRIVAMQGSSKTARVWDVETGKLVGKPLRGHTDMLSAVAISSDGKHVVSGSFDKTVRVWDVETGKPVGKPLRGHTDRVTSAVAISSDSKRVVSDSYQTIQVWDLETGKLVGLPLQGSVASVAISSDGKYAVSSSHDHTVCVWDMVTEQPVGEPLQGHTDSVSSVAISYDGKYVVSGSWDKTVRIWEVETGKLVGEPLRGHTHWVISVGISSDGKRIVSGSFDKTVRVWDVERGEPAGEPLIGDAYSVKSVAFLPDDKFVVSCSWNGTVRIWDLEALKM